MSEEVCGGWASRVAGRCAIELLQCFSAAYEFFEEEEEVRVREIAFALWLNQWVREGVSGLYAKREHLSDPVAEGSIKKLHTLADSLEAGFMDAKQPVERFMLARPDLTRKQRKFLREEVLTIPFKDAP